jgi:hypothetical protein
MLKDQHIFVDNSFIPFGLDDSDGRKCRKRRLGNGFDTVTSILCWREAWTEGPKDTANHEGRSDSGIQDNRQLTSLAGYACNLIRDIDQSCPTNPHINCARMLVGKKQKEHVPKPVGRRQPF